MRIADYSGSLLDRYGGGPPEPAICYECGEEDCPWDNEDGHPQCMTCEWGIASKDCECDHPVWECPDCPEPSKITKAYYLTDWACQEGHRIWKT